MRATVTLVVSALLALGVLGCEKPKPPAPPKGGGSSSGGPGPANPSNPSGTVQNPTDTPPVAVKGRPWNGLIMGPRTATDKTIVVKEIAPNSPAEKAGLRVGDLILKRNGEPAGEPETFKTWIQSLQPDTRYTLTVQREGKELEVTVTVGVRTTPDNPRAKLTPDKALDVGVEWLANQQQEDGAWPHAFEGTIKQKGKSNPAVTGLALSALSTSREGRTKYAARIAKGIQYLLSRETPKGYLAEPDDQMKYGNFATAYAVIVMCRVDRSKYREPIQKLVAYLKRAQINEEEDFQPYDWPYGGWDYFDDIRRTRLRADIVLASLAIEALHEAGVGPADDVMKNALKYVKMCQNWKDDPNQLSELDDGGFFFTPREGKAGGATVGSSSGNMRFKSYGSVTLDGIRSLLWLGEKKDSPRVQAARNWIAEHWSLEAVPGFDPNPAVDFPKGLRFYYYMAMAKTLSALGDPMIRNASGSETPWARDLASYVAGLQRADGSWANDVSVMNEDDPIFATGMAVHALAVSLGRAQ